MSVGRVYKYSKQGCQWDEEPSSATMQWLMFAQVLHVDGNHALVAVSEAPVHVCLKHAGSCRPISMSVQP